MKILKTSLSQWWTVFRNYPLVMVASFALCTSLSILAESSEFSLNVYTAQHTLFIAIPLMFSLNLLYASRRLGPLANMLLLMGALALLAIYFLAFQQLNTFEIKTALLVITAVMAVPLMPRYTENKNDSFWYFSEQLIYRLIISILFMLALMLLIFLAVMGGKELLGFDWNYKIYMHISSWIFGFIGIWFFLAGVEPDPAKVEHKYKKLISIFARFILIPASVIYLIILYAYCIKIAISGQWPEGMVSTIIIAYSAVTLASFLLLYPLQKTMIWVRRYISWAFALLLPLLVVMYMAASQRIAQYGITEMRYLLVVLTLLLTILSIYYIFSRSKNLKLIPISIIILALFSSFGPWGASSVSFDSQMSRFENTLDKRYELSGNAFVARGRNDSSDIQLQAIAGYLDRYHDMKPLCTMLAERTGRDAETLYKYGSRELIAQITNSEYVTKPDSVKRKFYSYAQLDAYKQPFSIKGYTHCYQPAYDWAHKGNDSVKYDYQGRNTFIHFYEDSLLIETGVKLHINEKAAFDLQLLAHRIISAKKTGSSWRSQFIFEQKKYSYKWMFVLREFDFYSDDGESIAEISSLSFDVYSGLNY